jgi:hypothetical protein
MFASALRDREGRATVHALKRFAAQNIDHGCAEVAQKGAPWFERRMFGAEAFDEYVAIALRAPGHEGGRNVEERSYYKGR